MSVYSVTMDAIESCIYHLSNERCCHSSVRSGGDEYIIITTSPRRGTDYCRAHHCLDYYHIITYRIDHRGGSLAVACAGAGNKSSA